MFLFSKKYKSVGQTPKQLLDLLEKETFQKYFHLGNLDIMAEGLMVFINSRLRFLEKYLKKLSKIYEFEIIEGFTTDTYDLLGVIKTITPRESYNLRPLELKIPFSSNFPLVTTQRPPKVSYKNLNSKAKLKNFLSGGKLPTLPKKQVSVYSLKYLGGYKVTKIAFFSKLKGRFSRIEGNYRQKKVFNMYLENKEKLPKTFIIRRYRVKVSSGFYVRSFVNDISVLNKKHLTTYSIKRLKLGFWRL
jgi:tRNA U55 pseudouridine synthase TruB